MVSIVLLLMLKRVIISLFCKRNEHLTSFLSTKYWYLKTDLEHARHNKLLGAETQKLIVALLLINLWIPKSLYPVRYIPSLVSVII